MTPTIQADDHRRVSEAVEAAEALSDGEIVAMVAPQSDAYHDAALHWTVLVMLGAPALLVLAPAEAIERALSWGWPGGPVYGSLLAGVLLIEIVLFLACRFAFASVAMRMALTPEPTKIRRVRRRAIQFFRAGAEKRTVGRSGVLIYLSLAERRAEIVADEAIHARVDAGVWTGAMDALIAQLGEGRAGDGLVEAIGKVGAILAAHFPKTPTDPDELPDRLIEL